VRATRPVHALVVGAALVATGAACGEDAPAEPIRLGVIGAQSGDLDSVDLYDTLLLAVEEVNRAGGVLGRPIVLEPRDDAATAEGASAAYAELLAAEVPAIVGPQHSAGVLAIADQIRIGRTLTLSGTATAPAIATMNDGGFFFRTIPSDDVQSIVLADEIVASGREHLCVVHRRDPYGLGLAAALRGRLAGHGIVPVESAYDPSAPLDQVMAPCDRVRAESNPGVVFITFQGDGRVILDDAAQRGWDATTHRLFLVDGNQSQELFDGLAHADAFDGAIGTVPSGPGPESLAGQRRLAFEGRFTAKYQRVVAGQSENHYDAAYLAMLAIEIAGTADDRDATRDAVARTARGAGVDAGDWAGLRAAIAGHGQVDYRGASGEADLEPISGELLPPYYIAVWTIRSGRIQTERVVEITER